ncbi:MAG: hypothetical protein A3G91_06355 [Omnitrophica WOR_2 bacterium RIFCSPLOWO2_12_FULL_50_9]|nr:MAG: hypothetical protein A3D87_07615 [Omnitrophica WOR_2 bacterium RIFCSPHIGHO2_02_FULL_50_17]OGX41376.1 MAG: hypothetical protein A3G91_06355 [Omnitrophica WOR_2 bacterium RIFCSPLOWO2_12_FULL_50_9]
MKLLRSPLQGILLIVLLTSASFAHAQPTQVIALKDGSTLQGKVLQLVDGVYTIETEALGKVHIRQADIFSVSAQNPLPSPGDSGTKEQLVQMQNNLMADPDLMIEIQNLAEDKEVTDILSDPNLFNALLNHDVQQIEGNENFQKLLNNPKMKALAEKMQQKSLVPADTHPPSP